MNFYQDGTTLSGDWNYGGTKHLVTGTMNGYSLTGAMKNPTTMASAFTFTNLTISPDAKTITGYMNGWGGVTWTKQPGVIIKVTPNAPAIAKPGDVLAFVGEVGGAADKSITWSATAGSVVNGSYTVPAGVDYTAQVVTATSNADGTKKATAQVSVTPTGILDISGLWKDAYGYPMNFYQDGTTLSGDWNYGGTKHLVTGTMNGYSLTGAMKNPTTMASAFTFTNLTISPDAKTITGYMNGWGGVTWTKQPGVIIQITPNTPTIAKAGDVLEYKAQVGGAPNNKTVLWEVTAGTIVAGTYTVPPDHVDTAQTISSVAAADPSKRAMAQVSITQNGVLNVSGVYKDIYNYQVVLLQNGTSVSGEWNYGGNKYNVEATLSGYVLSGRLVSQTNSNSVFTFTNLTAAPDVRTIAGYMNGWGSVTWTKQVGSVAVSITPNAVTLRTGASQNFTGGITGVTNPSLAWTVLEANGGTITQAGLYTAPVTPGTYTVKVTSVMDPTKSAQSVATVKLPVVVSPGTATVNPGGSFDFSAQLTGFTNSAVTWSATGGTVSTTGKYTAPEEAGTYTITATSVENSAYLASATVTVPFSLTVLPAGSTVLGTGRTQAFQAVIAGSVNKAVTWEVVAPGIGTIGPDGVFVAPQELPDPVGGANVYVKATSVARPTESKQAHIALKTSVLVTPQKVTVNPGTSKDFSASLFGVTGSVTWSATGGTFMSSQSNICTWKAPDQAGTYTITATSDTDGTLVGSTTVTVPILVSLEAPSTNSMLVPCGLPFSVKVKVEGSTNQKVLWSAEGITMEEITLASFPWRTSSMTTGGPGNTPQESNVQVVGYWGPQVDNAFGGKSPSSPRTFTLVARAEADPNAVQRITLQSMAVVAIWPGELTVPAETSYLFKDVMAIGMSRGWDALTGFVIGDRLSDVVSLETTGGRAEWLDADRISGLGNVQYRVATPQDPPPTSTGSLGMVANSINDLKYTAPDTAGTYFIALKPKLNPETPTTVKVHVPFTIQIEGVISGTPIRMGSQLSLRAKVSGSPNKAVDWKVSTGYYGATAGTISPEGIYDAPLLLPDSFNSISVALEARSQADPSKLAYRYYTVNRPLYLTAYDRILRAGASRQINATLTGLATNQLTWSCTGGSISQSGLYVAPELAGDYIITATSVAEPGVSASYVMTVPFEVIISPGYWQSTPPGGTIQYQAQVYGDPLKQLQWSVDKGTISSEGLYQAPMEIAGDSTAAWATVRHTNRPAWSYSFPISIAKPVKPLSLYTGWGSTVDPKVTMPVYAYRLGTYTTAVTWSVTGGTITSNGVWTLPDLAGTYSVTGTSTEDPTATASLEIQVRTLVRLVEGSSVFVRAGTTYPLKAEALGFQNPGLVWTFNSGQGSEQDATLDMDGTFHAPLLSDVDTRFHLVKVASVEDPTKLTHIGVTIRKPLLLNYTTATVQPKGTFGFQVTRTGVSGNLYWSCSGGTIDQTGGYTAPNLAGTYTVTVASVDEPGVMAQATVKVPISVKVTPASALLPAGYTQGFFATVAGDPQHQVTWSVVGPSPMAPAGTINQFGAYTPPSIPGTYTVTATSVVDPTKSNFAAVKVPQLLVLSPERITMKPGESRKFTAMGTTPTGTPTVTWKATGGTVASDGTYTAPADLGTYSVTATSTVDAAVSATAEVRVTTQGAITIDLSPTSVQLKKGGTMAFNAVVSGATNSAITWTTTGGAVTADGQYTAPAQFGTFKVNAMSVEDPTVQAEATIVVSAMAGEDQDFTYDENGNLLSDGERSFEWDVENRLVSVTKGTHRSEFEYDPLGRRSRITEKDSDGQGGWTTGSDKRYLWEGAEIVEEEAADGSTLKAFYGQGFVDTDGTALFYTRDHLGSVRELVDVSGAVRARYDYDPYGRMTKLSGDRDSLFLYTGHLWHQQSGLFLTLFRAYDPALGRWISRDPIGEAAGSNLYAYLLGDPLNFIDPLGLDGVYYWPKTGPNTTLGHVAVEIDGVYYSLWPSGDRAAAPPWADGEWHSYAYDLKHERIKPQFFPLDGKNYPDPSKLPKPTEPPPTWRYMDNCADLAYRKLKKKYNLGPNLERMFTPKDFWDWINANWGKPNPKWPGH
ncbi:MAG: hypothetical protein HYZ13_12895 [Acidobacteria bacterium]|nr:hypothetical protein [Acidobacteriota bacterium]